MPMIFDLSRPESSKSKVITMGDPAFVILDVQFARAAQRFGRQLAESVLVLPGKAAGMEESPSHGDVTDLHR